MVINAEIVGKPARREGEERQTDREIDRARDRYRKRFTPPPLPPRERVMKSKPRC